MHHSRKFDVLLTLREHRITLFQPYHSTKGLSLRFAHDNCGTDSDRKLSPLESLDMEIDVNGNGGI